jgi:hypothetical protein
MFRECPKGFGRRRQGFLTSPPGLVKLCLGHATEIGLSGFRGSGAQQGNGGESSRLTFRGRLFGWRCYGGSIDWSQGGGCRGHAVDTDLSIGFLTVQSHGFFGRNTRLTSPDLILGSITWRNILLVIRVGCISLRGLFVQRVQFEAIAVL